MENTDKDKELKQEALEFYKEEIEGEPLTQDTPIECFVAGANSKIAEIKKLEFAIEKLEEIRRKMTFYEALYAEDTSMRLHSMIADLNFGLELLKRK